MRGARMHLEIFGQIDAGDAPEVFTLDTRQVFSLLFAVQMLQATAAALAVQRAARFHAVGARFKNFYGASAGKILLRERERHLAEFPRQGSRNKAHATIGQARHALATLHHLLDTDLERFASGLQKSGAVGSRPARPSWLVKIAGHRA